MTIAKILPARPPAATKEGADALLELAFLMTAVDGRLEDDELVAYRELASWMRGAAVSDDDFAALLAQLADHIDKKEIEARVRAVGPALPPALRELAFKVAIGLALVDRDPSADEDELVGVLFESLGLDAERAEALAGEVRRAFGVT